MNFFDIPSILNPFSQREKRLDFTSVYLPSSAGRRVGGEGKKTTMNWKIYEFICISSRTCKNTFHFILIFICLILYSFVVETGIFNVNS
jgi:hypothetical protein